MIAYLLVAYALAVLVCVVGIPTTYLVEWIKRFPTE